ncbi:hypothetical protein HZY97_05735 [Sphingomonas sp. R-74633]|uniref:hypothetical protein n=1 Tax=Sphingomonas sp. R-74633 TaxID=2751188 RepID=UPI0015D3AF3D|nr:hypothetical protein [Sphingomonas sp. R-74633]NYT40248.1 hypothetical protein [Sphingomonas sp. R-74633]
MMLRWMVLPVSGLVLMAAQAAPQEASAPAAPAPAPGKKLCRMIAPVGTIIPKRYCLTRDEWKKVGDASENGNENYRNRTSIGCGKPGADTSCGGS